MYILYKFEPFFNRICIVTDYDERYNREMMNDTFSTLDNTIIRAAQKISLPLARFAIFVVFFWFGILKVIGTSPANPLVQGLMEKTIPFMTFGQFIVLFGIYEMIIGIVFLFPKLVRLAIALLVPHMITTFLPLVLLPSVTWQEFFVPTLEGQYIIKNLVIIALALAIASHLEPTQATEHTHA